MYAADPCFEFDANEPACPCGKGVVLKSGQAKEFLGAPERVLEDVLGEPFISYEYRGGSMSVYDCHHTVVSVRTEGGVAVQVEGHREHRRHPRVKPSVPIDVYIAYGAGGQCLLGKVLDISVVAVAIECFGNEYPELGTTALVGLVGIGEVVGRIYRIHRDSGRVVIMFSDEKSGSVQAIRSYVAEALAGSRTSQVPRG